MSTSCQSPWSISEMWSITPLNFLQPHGFLGLSWEHEFICCNFILGCFLSN